MRTRLPALAITAAAAVAVNLLLPAATPAPVPAAAVAPGTISTESMRAATLGEDIDYNVYLPAGYESSSHRFPVIYLLHGRGDSMSAWTQVKSRLDELISTGEIPPPSTNLASVP